MCCAAKSANDYDAVRKMQNIAFVEQIYDSTRMIFDSFSTDRGSFTRIHITAQRQGRSAHENPRVVTCEIVAFSDASDQQLFIRPFDSDIPRRIWVDGDVIANSISNRILCMNRIFVFVEIISLPTMAGGSIRMPRQTLSYGVTCRIFKSPFE